MRVTVLIENSPGDEGLHHEHGLSFLLEVREKTVLFDTGKTGAFLDNAHAMGLAPEAADLVVLSHGHYDHSGGFRRLVQAGYRGLLCLGDGALDAKHSSDPAGLRFIGNDFDATWILEQGIPLHVLPGTGAQPVRQELLPGLYLFGGFPAPEYPESIPARMVKTSHGAIIADTFRDEICLVLESSQGLVVLLGCAHPGIVTMLSAITRSFGKAIFAVLGGSHLVEADEERVEWTMRQLEEMAIPHWYLGHCTGQAAVDRFSSYLPNFTALHTGMRVVLPD